MAENKKSFVLYADLLKSIDHLTNEEKGILFNHLLEYVNDKNPILQDRLILTAWKPIELQLKRDLIKFVEVKEKRSDAGKRSAELKALKSFQQTSTNSTSVKSVEQSSTNSTVNVNVNDNVINIKEDYLKKSNQSKEDLRNSYTMIIDLAKIYKSSEHYVKQKLEEFIVNQDLAEELDRPLKELRKHFANWLKSNPPQEIWQRGTMSVKN
jgi:uncharacterized protein YdaU (DUF1376 family)